MSTGTTTKTTPAASAADAAALGYPPGLYRFEGVAGGIDGFAAVDDAAVERRRALQFHYAPAGAASVSTEQRMAVFGSEGKSVTC